MRKLVIAAASICLIGPPPAQAQSGTYGQNPAEQVEKAERAFAAMAGKEGTRSAFLHWFADTSWILQPQPQDGRKFYAAAKEDGSLLSWRPQAVGVAGSGDLALSTGPWEFRPSKDAQPVATGHFLSIWRKQKDGAWRVEVDAGVPHAPDESASDITLEWGSLRRSLAAAEEAVPAPDLGARLKELAAEEAALAKEAGQIGWRCLANRLADESLVYRRRSAPIAARKEQAAALEKDGLGTSAALSASGVSKDGTFGYTLGTVALKEGPGRSFFRIWQRGAQGWRVLCDLQLPLPEEKKAEEKKP